MTNCKRGAGSRFGRDENKKEMENTLQNSIFR